MEENFLQCLDTRFAYKLSDQSLFPSRKSILKKHGFAAMHSASLFHSWSGASELTKVVDFYETYVSTLSRCLGAKREALVLFSGGVDSEILVRLLLSLGVKVRLLTTDLFRSNSYDLTWAKELSQELKLEHKIYSVSEDYWRLEGLERVCDIVESASYMCSAAVLGALEAAKYRQVVFFAGDGPSQLRVRTSGRISCIEEEYQFWPLKLREELGLEIFDPFWSRPLSDAFLFLPLIRERLCSLNTFEDYVFDVSRLSKEHYYQSFPSTFGKLKRRFSQHGLETVQNLGGFRKEMFPAERVTQIESISTQKLSQSFVRKWNNKSEEGAVALVSYRDLCKEIEILGPTFLDFQEICAKDKLENGA